ncbi:2,6-dihydropseudooxynicotine hydrolase [Stieleria neptunia]|uniref:2,6-dihydropseudooxynicotine hydrolase n=1 Tax=Stieleria neptunia TaxID=2527979 RepID=A0A518HWE4_9BACT|nr:alpha/beta fold hydrolase [Stieleria neptunia]QDV45178.1 2,6-dihydropseudooxynicotine hydrolase [Stieleria neptunia]
MASPRTRQRRLVAFATIVVGVVATVSLRLFISPAFDELRHTQPTETLAEMRTDHETRLVRREPVSGHRQISSLAAGRWFEFPSDARLLYGYYNEPSGNGPHPTIVFAHGGFLLGSEDIEVANQLVEHGYAVFAPTWRGENGNAGAHEMCYGEVDDMIAAIDFVERLPSVDEDQIFLLGHSIGGLLAVLTAEVSPKPRGAMACGAVMSLEVFARHDPTIQEKYPYDTSDNRENVVRSPLSFVKDLKCPLLLAYGSQESALIQLSERMRSSAERENKRVESIEIPNADHFTAFEPSIPRALSFFDSLQSQPRQTQRPSVAKAPTNLAGQQIDRLIDTTPGPPLAGDSLPRQIPVVQGWNSLADPGPAIADWRWIVSRLIERDEFRNVRVLPDNPYWAVAGEFGTPGFAILSVDGKKQYRYKNAFPRPITPSVECESQFASLSKDGRLFAVRNRAALHPTEPNVYWVSVHRTDGGSLVKTMMDHDNCQFLNASDLLVWKDAGSNPQLRAQRQAGPGAKVAMLLNTETDTWIERGMRIYINGPVPVTPGGQYFFHIDAHTRTWVARDAKSGHRFDLDLEHSGIAVSTSGLELAAVANELLTVRDLQTGEVKLTRRVAPQCITVDWLDNDRFLILNRTFVVDRADGTLIARLNLDVELTKIQSMAVHDRWITTANQLGERVVHEIPIELIRKLAAMDDRNVTVDVTIADSFNRSSQSQLKPYATRLLEKQGLSLGDENSPILLTLQRVRWDDPPARLRATARLRLFGEELPQMKQSGLSSGFLRQSPSFQGKVTATVQIRPKPPAENAADVWRSESITVDSVLDDVELTQPLEPQLHAAFWAKAISSLDLKRLGLPRAVGFQSPDDHPLMSTHYTSVLARTPELQANAGPESAKPTVETLLTYSDRWIDQVRKDLGLRASYPRKSPVIATQLHSRDTMPSSFARGSVGGIGLVNVNGIPELLIMSHGSKKETTWQRLSQVGTTQTKITQSPNQFPSALDLAVCRESGRWVHVGREEVVFGESSKDAFRVKRVEMPHVRSAVFSDEERILYLSFQERLEAWDANAIWTDRFWVDGVRGEQLKSVRKIKIRDEGVLSLRRVPKSKDLIGYSSKAVIRFNGLTGETVWEIPCDTMPTIMVDAKAGYVYLKKINKLQSNGIPIVESYVDTFNVHFGNFVSSSNLPKFMNANHAMYGKYGSRMAISGQKVVAVYDLATMEPVWTKEIPRGFSTRLAYSEDGNALAVHVNLGNGNVSPFDVWSFREPPK